jgi:hypothetical protein
LTGTRLASSASTSPAASGELARARITTRAWLQPAGMADWISTASKSGELTAADQAKALPTAGVPSVTGFVNSMPMRAVALPFARRYPRAREEAAGRGAHGTRTVEGPLSRFEIGLDAEAPLCFEGPERTKAAGVPSALAQASSSLSKE